MIESIVKRKITFLLALVAIGVLIIIVVRLLASRTPKQGVLKISSTPVASVFLDNKNVGRTPYEDKVTVGDYTVKVVPESTVTSFASWQGKVSVAPNTLTYINRELSESELTSSGEVLWLEKITSKSSEVDVITNPDGASILLDDALKGVSPLTVSDVSPADHAFTVTSPGFITKTLKVKTTAGYKVKVAIQLSLNPGSSAPTPTPLGVEGTPSITPVPSVSVTPGGSPTAKITPTKAATPSATPKSTPKATPTDPPKPFVKIKETGTGFLRVRKDPTTQSEELARVNPGDKFTIQDSKDVSGATWYQIKYDGTNLGWVSGQYVEKVE